MPDQRPQSAQGGTGRSRLELARPAQRRPVKARLAITGPAGAGKTWTGLSVATYLCPSRPILWIDTESNEPVLDDEGNPVLDGQGRPTYNTSAELYADSFDNIVVIPWLPPFSVVDLTKTIIDAGPHYGLVGVDSSSHFWQKEGGTLDRANGTFGGWKVARPEQDAFMQAVLSCPAHVILCTRAKMTYEVGKDERDRQVVTKLGLAPIQDGDLEYEMQVVVAMQDDTHRMDVGKTRAAPLAGRSFHANQEHEFAGIYADWLSRGKAMARMAEVDAVRRAVFAITDQEKRAMTRTSFLDEFGPTEYLERDRMPDVWVWLMAARGLEPHPFEPVEVDPEPPSEDHPDGLPGGPTPFCRICGTTIVATWHDISAPRGTAAAAEPTGDDPDAAPPGPDPDPADAPDAEPPPEPPEAPQDRRTGPEGDEDRAEPANGDQAADAVPPGDLALEAPASSSRARRRSAE